MLFKVRFVDLLNFLVDPVNQQSLDVIERAQFFLCLDQAHPQLDLSTTPGDSIHDNQKTRLANRVLHGNGSQHNSCNRWLDHAIEVSEVILS